MTTAKKKTADILLAIALTFIACSNDDGNEGNGGSGNGNSSSDGSLLSSSSSPSQSSSSLGAITVIYGDPVTDIDGQTYETVVIGKQTWMAKNLNRDINGSKCYSDNDVNCTIYGRLYNWEMVMNGAEGSDKNPSGVQGICPAGFHVPSDVEWGVLSNQITQNVLNGFYGSLRATYGWNDNYTDDYGFSALPGGYYSTSYYNGVGSEGNWWNATHNGTNAYYYREGSYSGTRPYNNSKSYMYSLRCVKNDAPPSSSSYTPVNCPSVPAGSFCDDRDGKAYKSTTIGNQTWMAENLKFEPEGCSNSISSIGSSLLCLCSDNGCIYDKAAAMALEPACSNSYCVSQITSSHHKGICPNGWHVPSEAEMDELIESVGGIATAGQMLKAKSGWSSGNGMDAFDFSALPLAYPTSNTASWWNVRYNNNSHQCSYVDTGARVNKGCLVYINAIRCVMD